MDWKTVTEKANQLFIELHQIHVDFYRLWASEVLLTWRWWIALGLIIIPWGVWFLVRKKESADRLLHAGFFVMLVSSSQDMIGIALGLWSYPVNVFPLMPEFIPFDISALPVATMLFIQFLPKLRPFYKAVIYSACGSFIFQPVMKFVGLYDNLGWKNYYSFPILIAIYLAANYISNKDRYGKIS
jgi:hypothetical protein